mmetsp:Transcript_10307/g.30187  ORF Transcript_10307/g.30187 Transcript_10307/m.30187 type:complete len:693 (-) Transcript_10307:224-2302(-)|eukprot:CAMPEP_0172366624 /NCGR_PEP_ID=MMETSP1060-20121228/16181_1 /TAXON_ID=37318 /ORGANISM="Pseudo-nitzschia pungens, Strain cf. cingulata" /LENGTH=692 /DNA_ID=CAMNT_0013090557 /DNA_START=38 /DNA_END=2116 /DNA_ORIENTATION=+
MNLNPDILDGESDWSEYVTLREDSIDYDRSEPKLSPTRVKDEEQRQLITPSPSCKSLYSEMPPQLHPACSIGIQRVSSCYFSLASANNHESMSDLLSQLGDNTHESATNHNQAKQMRDDNKNDAIDDSVDVFYHDILMQVFTFLDAKSLLCFSETARRPNFEVFYFLQLQLQQSLLLDNSNVNNIGKSGLEVTHGGSTVEGSASLLTRVARIDMGKARELVEHYQDSNSTLRTMPLSYSLAYIRHYLLRNGFHNMFHNTNTNHDESNSHNSSKTAPSSHTLASAAIFMTVVGAASLVSSSDASAITMVTDRFGTELPNVLFRVGFVGSLMRAISETERGTAMREKAEQMARSMQAMPAALMPARRNERDQQEQQESEESENQESNKSQSETQQKMNSVLPSLFEMRHMLQEMMSTTTAAEKRKEQQPMVFDPYGHLPSEQGAGENVNDESKICDDDENSHSSSKESNQAVHVSSNSTADRKMPSGCVGAYSRVIHQAADYIAEHTKETRKATFKALSPEDQRLRSLQFLSACTSNDRLDGVKAMISSVDVDQFYVGSDGTETCVLHTAAFNGADKVVEFLCAGVDNEDPRLDGGLCDVNSKDNNGWTALHFAAGSNSVAAVRVLAHHGAVLNIEAQNGYTPLSWANRLSNDGVANELNELMNTVGADQSNNWMSREPLASIANRFFSLIPTQ